MNNMMNYIVTLVIVSPDILVMHYVIGYIPAGVKTMTIQDDTLVFSLFLSAPPLYSPYLFSFPPPLSLSLPPPSNPPSLPPHLSFSVSSSAYRHGWRQQRAAYRRYVVCLHTRTCHQRSAGNCWRTTCRWCPPSVCTGHWNNQVQSVWARIHVLWRISLLPFTLFKTNTHSRKGETLWINMLVQ